MKSAIITGWSISAQAVQALNQFKKTQNMDFLPLDYFLDCFLISEEKEKQIEELLNQAIRKEYKEAA